MRSLSKAETVPLSDFPDPSRVQDFGDDAEKS